ncbi:TonB-dependent receptor [Granulicella arctica]|uniref:TonB-dependent receptor n=1 Tax=Granulicella arctica TaxID=940613 RepID=UPI0021E09827|nr:TonB-dependent receptor [Granulicella arctica]
MTVIFLSRFDFNRFAIALRLASHGALVAIATSAGIASLSGQTPAPAWRGVVEDAPAHQIAQATIALNAGNEHKTATTTLDGAFVFNSLLSKTYSLTVEANGRTYRTPTTIKIPAQAASVILMLQADGTLIVGAEEEKAAVGGEQLTSKAVSEIPLNKRDFSQLLLLAAGTAADSSGASNFTQQFAINGQRGVEAVFALDGADSSDPELGGGTFTNLNVDAVLELQSLSGVMPAEIGRGASGFTNILTRSGTDSIHGSVFEFLRNSSLDARNYFDHPSPASPGRIPPFKRNEFGFTNGGPIILPHLYNGRGKAFYFVEYQGFRQVLGTTQVFAVPTMQQRVGMDTTAYAGDLLTVPVDSAIAKVLARYPLPNLPSGTFGANTYATSSKVTTNADQFSLRLDYQLGTKDHLFGRITFDNLDGPITNPDQTAIDPSFGVEYVDRQRNGVVTWIHTASPRFTFETSISATRTTPSFPTTNQTDPAIKFNDALFEPFNAPGGSVTRAFGNLFHGRENVSFTTANHALKVGFETRLNRDSTYFGISPNGEYDFGGGTAYARTEIKSQSGTHDVHIGDPLPDTLSALLSGSPFAYTRAVAPSYFSNGENIGPASDNRSGFAAYIQDAWKVTDRIVLNYGLRYELYTAISDRARKTSGFYPAPNGGQQFLVNPQPGYKKEMNNWGPRVQVDYRFSDRFRGHAGAGLTTIPPNIWQDNQLTGALPFVVYPRVTAAVGAQIPYGFQITPAQLPRVYTPAGVDIFASGRSNDVPANTVLDIDRLERDIASLSGQPSPLNVSAISRGFGNAMLATWSLGLERSIGNVTASANYVGTTAYKLARNSFPNAYPGATAAFARFTQFNASGAPVGGFGTESEITPTSHSSYHALQLSAAGQTPHGGPGMQASYTWSKSIDDTSTVAGTSATSTVGAIAQAAPQNPFDTHSERGPSTFDATHSFSLSLTQELPIQKLPFLDEINRKATEGWQLISISSISSGTPFTVYSGIQQTGAGSANADRPDQIAQPTLSTARARHEDYFGRGDSNGTFFSIPIGIAGGTGPNLGRFGTLGRNTFRGPAFYNFDMSLAKDTPVGKRKSGSELVNVQFRAEFFNIFNIVNMGLPSNTILGSGFGLINRTAGSSRQIQFSLKVAY